MLGRGHGLQCARFNHQVSTLEPLKTVGHRIEVEVEGIDEPLALQGTGVRGHRDGSLTCGKRCANELECPGADPTDGAAAAAGLPPIDSVDLWPMLSGANTTSPRVEIAIAVDFAEFSKRPDVNTSALISGRWKLLEGVQTQTYHQGPAFPNASSPPYGVFTDRALLHLCKPACLYDILADPTEQHNVALAHLDGIGCPATGGTSLASPWPPFYLFVSTRRRAEHKDKICWASALIAA